VYTVKLLGFFFSDTTLLGLKTQKSFSYYKGKSKFFYEGYTKTRSKDNGVTFINSFNFKMFSNTKKINFQFES